MNNDNCQGVIVTMVDGHVWNDVTCCARYEPDNIELDCSFV